MSQNKSCKVLIEAGSLPDPDEFIITSDGLILFDISGPAEEISLGGRNILLDEVGGDLPFGDVILCG